MLKVLISNDDGIHATGIRTLTEVLSEQYAVYVVAPDRERSATGHALTLHKPIKISPHTFEFEQVKDAYAVSGTPSDCVKLGLKALYSHIDFDILVSGINHGPNLGSDVIYSGTVSAALEGALHSLPSIAVSLMNGYDKQADFLPAAHFIRKFLPKALDAGIPKRHVLNINVPAVPESYMAGVQVCHLGTRMYTDAYERRVDPRGGIYYWLAGEVTESDNDMDSDVEAIRNNMVSITPVHCDLTAYTEVGRLAQVLS
ncbi:MAG: 5'/3'-nucleotidase SurE [Cyanobacteria bacterium P01_H01_bin.74]